MRTRLIVAIVGTLAQEAALLVIVLWGLPQLGIHLPIWGLIILMLAWGVLAIVLYRAGSRALGRKAVVGLTVMIGNKGTVIKPLVPEGYIKIRGELWRAASVDENIEVGEEVTVVGQDGLKLIVSKRGAGDGSK